MMFFLSQFLPLLFLPIGICLMLVMAGIVTRRRWPLVTAFMLLWVSSMPFVGNRLSWAMDDGQVRIPGREAPSADAIVVLSSGRPVAPGDAKVSEWADGDRFFGGIELYKAGKAPLLIFTGGWTPFAPTAPLEGEILAGVARELGVPSDRVLVTGRVVNTLEESRQVATLVAGREPRVASILLVTSAFHMSRARVLFERAGFIVLPFPVDFGSSRAGRFNLVDLLPTAAALFRTQVAWREVYGRIVYRLLPLS